jgi:hypothetical protein
VSERDISTIEDFQQAVDRHDLTHAYSDDHSVYRRGAADYDRIHKSAAKFPREDVERIWNAMVDRSLVESARAQFYWRWPKAPPKQGPGGCG